VPLTLEFRWSTREACWYMNVRDEDEIAPFVEGVKVVVGWQLGRRAASVRNALGLFCAVDLSGAATDPGINDLGDRVQLLYYSRDELPID